MEITGTVLVCTCFAIEDIVTLQSIYSRRQKRCQCHALPMVAVSFVFATTKNCTKICRKLFS